MTDLVATGAFLRKMTQLANPEKDGEDKEGVNDLTASAAAATVTAVYVLFSTNYSLLLLLSLSLSLLLLLCQ